MDRAVAVALAALAAAACTRDPEVPAAPTWAEHVKPIVDAACAGCHGASRAVGAGLGYRLDSYDDRAGVAGELIAEGAGAMAETLAARAGDGHGGLDDTELATLVRWAERAGPFDGSAPAERPPRGARLDNQPPTITVSEVSRDGSVLRIAYRIADADDAVVYGEARVGATLASSRIVPGALHDGAGRLDWDTAGEPEGTTGLFAILDDGSPPLAVELDALAVSHDGGDVPPRITLYGPPPSALLTDRDEVEVAFGVVDPDAPGPQQVQVRAVGDAGTVTIAADLAVISDATYQVPWDTAGLAEGSWVVEIEAAGRVTRSGPLTVSHAATAETWASIAPLLEARCAGCHTPGRLFDLPIDLGRYAIRAAGEPPGAFDVRHQIYRRAITLGDMPPRAGPGRLAAPIPLRADERARLQSWLRAGAPE